MKKLILLCKGLLLVSFASVSGQTEDTENTEWNIIPDYIAKSPEAASFLRYGDYKTNLSKGTTEISIPLYTLEAGSFKLPIALSYNPTGIKTNQEATWVGLGWDLSPGAQIVLEVRDTPDEHVQGEMPDLDYVQAQMAGIPEWNLNHPNIIDLRRESWIKDVYHFRSPTASGKFVIGNDDTVGAIVYPPEAFKVEVLGSASARRFKVTDPHGNVYDFNATREISTTVGIQGAQSYTSAWLVDAISTPSHNIISLSYTNDGWHAQRNVNDKVTHTSHIRPCDIVSTDHQTLSANATANSMSITKTYKLASIEYRNQRILFQLEQGRLDLASPSLLAQATYPGNVPPSLLKMLKVQHKTENSYTDVRAYDFAYSYFTAQGTEPDYYRKRLRLDAVSDLSGEETTSFNYSTVNLPSKNSRSMDAWGYCNGANNSTLIPKQYIWVRWTATAYAEHVLIGSANRHVNPNYIQAGMLTEIVYPTKGKTRFTYEPNDFWGIDELSKTNEVILSGNLVQGTGTPNGNPNVTAGSGIIPVCNSPNPINCPQYLLIEFNAPVNTQAVMTYQANYNGSLTINKYEYGRVRIVYFDGTDWDSGPHKNTISKTENVSISGQGYILIEAYGSSMNIQNFQLKYMDNNTAPKNVPGPGLRIRQIENLTDANTLAGKKIFTYRDPQNPTRSSGKLVFSTEKRFDPESHFHHSIVQCETNPGYTASGWKTLRKDLYGGQSKFYMMNEVSYTDAKEETVDPSTAENNGYATYKFSFAPSSGSQDGSILIEYDWLRGNLLEKRVYKDTQNTLVSVETNTYIEDTSTTSIVRGFKLFTRHTYGAPPTDTAPLPDLENMGYNYVLPWHYLKSSETTEFFYNGQIPTGSLSRTTNYFYDNPSHLQVTRIESTNSLGQAVVKKSYYPDDLPDAPNMLALKSQHRIAEVIRTENLTNSSPSIQNKTYRDWGNHLIMPETVEISKGTGTLEKRIRYSTMDNITGNPLEIQQENGMKISYVWGHSGTKPLVKIENLAYASIPSTLISAVQNASNANPYNEQNLLNAIASLRNSPALANAMVTTFTYKPLVGVSTITDPKGDVTSYQYDYLGRLRTVMDKDGNVLSENKYNYRP